MYVDEDTISIVLGFPMGLPWDKEERQEATNAKNLFFLIHEEPMEDKNGVKRESLS
jgi:hypothetical protein